MHIKVLIRAQDTDPALKEKGKTLIPVLEMMSQWDANNMPKEKPLESGCFETRREMCRYGFSRTFGFRVSINATVETVSRLSHFDSGE